MTLGLDHFYFLPMRFLPGATALRFTLGGNLTSRASLSFCEFPHQLRPCQFAIGGLGAFTLAPHFHASRYMSQPDSAACLVNFLAARPGTANESLLDVACAQAQSGHFFRDL